MFHAPASSWSSGASHPAPGVQPGWQQAIHPHRPAFPQAVRVVPAPYRAPTTPAALYVVLSFALMLVLAAMTSVFGSFAALALIDDAVTDEDETTEVAPPAASLNRR